MQLLERKEIYWIDIVKIIGLFMVSYAHIIIFGTYGLESFRIFPAEFLTQPLIPVGTQSIWKIDAFIFNHIKTEAGVIGVILFFLCSGYFIPYLQEKYNQKELPRLFFERLLKFWPYTFFCVFLCGILMYFWQGTIFSKKDYLFTALLCGTFVPTTTTMGVMWFMLVLVFAYLLASIFRKFTLKNLLYADAVLFLIMTLDFACRNTPMQAVYDRLVYVARFTGILFIGTAFKLSENKKIITRLFITLFYTVLAYILVKTGESVSNSPSSYSNVFSYVEVACIIGIVRLIDYVFPTLYKSCSKIIKFFNGIFFTFYLLHVHFGFALLYFFRKHSMNSYISVLLTYIIVILLAYGGGILLTLY